MCPLQHRKVVHKISIVGVCLIDIHRRVVHIISIVGVSPIDIHRRVVHIISIVGVGPIDIHRRVVHNIDYRSRSTIYIGGCPRLKKKIPLFGNGFLIHGLGKCEGVGEDSRHGFGHVDIRVGS